MLLGIASLAQPKLSSWSLHPLLSFLPLFLTERVVTLPLHVFRSNTWSHL